MKLTESMEIKLLVLYILNSVEEGRARRVFLSDFIADFVCVEYFDLQQNIVNLSKDKLIDIVVDAKKEYLVITDQGRTSLEYFNKKLPYVIREQIDLRLPAAKRKDKHTSEVEVDYTPINEQEYLAKLRIKDDAIELLNLEVNVGGRQNAILVASRFRENPSYYFSKIIELVTKESEEIK